MAHSILKLLFSVLVLGPSAALAVTATSTSSPTLSPTPTHSPTYTPAGSTPTASATRTGTLSATRTGTLSSTVSPTFSVSPTPTQTCIPGSCPSSTPTPSATRTPTATPTATPSATPSSTATRTATPSATPWATMSPIVGSPTFTPSATQTATTVPATPTLILDDFEDGDLVTTGGGTISVTNDALGGTLIIIMIVGGCDYGSSGRACNLQGSLVQDTGNSPFARCHFNLVPSIADLGPVARQRCLNLSYRNLSAGVTYRICLESPAVTDSDQYCYSFTPAVSGWQDLSVFFPDVAGSGLPRFSQAGTGAAVAFNDVLSQCRGVTIEPVASVSGPVNCNLDVDDLHFGRPPSRNNPLAVAAALGVSLAYVRQAYALEVDEMLAWIILRLTIYCGCTPQDIYNMRSTMSWGQIAVNVGATWPTAVAEAESMAQSGGLSCPDRDLQQSERALVNNPSLTPNMTPPPYQPSGSLDILPSAGGCQ